MVKIGGSTLGSHDTSLKDLARLQQEGREVVVVHGGGNVISQWMQRQGLAPRFVGGLRVTDAPSLEIVVAVLTGLINKELVSSMHEFGGRSVGLSGIDGSMVEAKIGNPELGFVGEVTTVNVDLIRSVLDSGYIPMIAPLGFHVRDGPAHAARPLGDSELRVRHDQALDRPGSSRQLMQITTRPTATTTRGWGCRN